jgi:uncharacterized membrane protein YgcG
MVINELQVTWLTMGMTIALVLVIVTVILYNQYSDDPVGWTVTGIISRVLEFAMSTMFLFSVGASSFRRLLVLVVTWSTSETDRSGGDKSNGDKKSSRTSNTGGGSEEGSSSTEAGLELSA